MELPAAVDVLVVGTGVAGLCTARALAERGAKVAVVGPRCDGRPRGHGQVLTGLLEHPYRVLASLGTERTRALYAFSRGGVERVSQWAPVLRSVQRWVALDPREHEQVARSADALAALGLPARLVREPALPGAGPAFELDGDGVVEPTDALAALAAGAERAGATRVVARVDAVDEDAAGLVVRIGVERVRAEVVVFAAGLGSEALEPCFEHKLVPIREQAIVTKPVPDAFPGAWRLGFGLTFLRQRADGALLVGGCRWATPHLEVGERDPVTVPKVQERIEAFARRYLPPVEIVERRAWIETHTCDGLPIVGPLPGTTRRIACAGFCGNDWGLAPAAALAVADGLLGERPEVPPFLSASRFL